MIVSENFTVGAAYAPKFSLLLTANSKDFFMSNSQDYRQLLRDEINLLQGIKDIDVDEWSPENKLLYEITQNPKHVKYILSASINRKAIYSLDNLEQMIIEIAEKLWKVHKKVT